jgi:uncharacterized membrane protein YeaQ/YmgE (transglycosylase-associated protein family)
MRRGERGHTIISKLIRMTDSPGTGRARIVRREHKAMGIIAWIVLGLIVGAIAKAIMPGRDGGGIILTMLLGIIGAFVGGIIGKYVFHTALGGFFNLRTWLLAILGAVVVLGIYHLATRRSSVTR